MSRYIDADAIKDKAWKVESEACFYALEDVVSVTDIDEAPSIDICFCRECKLGGTEDCPMDEIDDEYFCNFGEREDE